MAIWNNTGIGVRIEMLLEVRDLKISFDSDSGVKKAVDGIDFSVGENEIVAILGESGSGKTLSALSIMRLLPKEARLEAGEILFSGKDIMGLDDDAMRRIRGEFISMIFQEPFTSLNPVMRVGEQIIEVILAHREVSRRDAEGEVEVILRKVQIKDPKKIFNDYPHQLSGGERQRIMIAMALSLGPKLLIADEPTTALDVTIQSEILKLIVKLNKDARMSVLFITHDVGVANEVADRILVMKDGSIVEAGNKTEVLRSPKHEYTKRLLGAVPKVDTTGEVRHGRRPDFVIIESVSKTFDIERGFLRQKTGEVKAVNNVSIKIKKGETLGLVGESASGKTTLGKIVLGLTRADKGSLYIDGKDINEYLRKTPREIRRMMQIVFQDPYGSLDPHMRMGDIVNEGHSILGTNRKKRDDILKDILSKVNLFYKDRLKYPHQFSGGERQRIAIARALAVNPEFLVLDEPVSSLDVLIQAGILELLKNLQEEFNLTYLFISHDLRVVGYMSDEIAVMRKGEIVERGSKNSIYKSPKHPYTKRLLSSIPKL